MAPLERRRRLVTVAAVVAVVLMLAACTGGQRARAVGSTVGSIKGSAAGDALGPTTVATRRVAWAAEPAPPGAVQLTWVATAGAQLLVSGQRGRGDAASPGLWRRDVDGAWHEVRLTPVTYYGRRADLFRMVSDGRRLVALGRRIGGAHGNPRFTSWTGTLTRLRETEQPFELFGGPDAIAVTDLALTRDGGVVLGAWAPHGAASGVTVWRQEGTSWQRFDRAPGLASEVTVAGSELTTPGAVGVRGDEPVVVGWTTHLGGGRVDLRASFWSPFGATWHEVRLPSRGDAQARAVTCGDAVCTVAGAMDGRLALWTVDGADVRTLPSPDVAVAPREPVIAVRAGSAVCVSVGEGTSTRLVWVDGRSVTAVDGPPGVVTSLAASGSRVVALVRGADGATRLWSAPA